MIKKRLFKLLSRYFREELELELLVEDLVRPISQMGITDEVIVDLETIRTLDEFSTFQRLLQGHRRFCAKRSLEVQTNSNEQIIQQAKLQGEALAYSKLLRLFQKAKRARQHIKDEE